MYKSIAIIVLLFVLQAPSAATGAVLTSDTVWSGDVSVSEDVLVPEGVTLTVMPGTIIRVSPSESTKMEPEYMSPLTEITVRGTLMAEGTEENPVSFLIAEGNDSGGWAGIIIDGGAVHLKSCRIQDAETGSYVLKGVLLVDNSTIRRNHYGLVAQGHETTVKITNSRVTENDYGLISLNGAKTDTAGSTITENRKKDTYSSMAKDYGHSFREYKGDGKGVSKQYGEEVLTMDTIWQGNVEIDGIIRVPAGIRLIVLPGTVIEFKKRDTNGDGIGENGLLIQGLLIAKGTLENPILFRSAEKNVRMGDWDAINIMNSNGPQSLIEYCQIEDAYRALHFHFSNVAVNNSVLRNNYRGMQFQEAVVEIRANAVYGNKSGIRARDSEIVFDNNVVHNNYRGIDLLRDNLIAKANRVVNNLMEGIKMREGTAVIEENVIDGNRFGLMVTDMYYGNYIRNVITSNGEVGASMKNMDNIEVQGNFIAGNGLNGINVQNVRATIKGNQISENGERGIGIMSFEGVITENNFVRNGLYAVGLDGASDVSAHLNWWGGDDIEKIIYDRMDEQSRGRVLYEKPGETPFPYEWPVQSVLADITWYGDIVVKNTTTVLAGAMLTIMPKTKVEFAENSGLVIRGRMIASGEHEGKITFTSLHKKGASDWGEILLDAANGSMIAHCVFEYATWGIHSHFTRLLVSDSQFRRNYGGMRFMSGPVEVKRSRFEDNYIGLRSYRGKALITENVITGNEIGIFVREKGGGLTVTRNNIFTNSGYNMRVGDANDEDVNARENWWGNGNPVDAIFDGRTEPGIGKVLYEPYLKEPFTKDIPEGK
ncbi:MAG: right-handed parallel beta-helix repeat-containing protein [Nitrospiraceae bacterium]|nr:MAG: right-handed parallel beta-helix repeat-containing protein [Nitrospiraceae bacterium]